MEIVMEEIKKISGCCTDIKTIIELDKRAVEDLENNTHTIDQIEVLTIIREFIRCKNDYEYIKRRYIPKYLVQVISNDLQEILKEK